MSRDLHRSTPPSTRPTPRDTSTTSMCCAARSIRRSGGCGTRGGQSSCPSWTAPWLLHSINLIELL